MAKELKNPIRLIDALGRLNKRDYDEFILVGHFGRITFYDYWDLYDWAYEHYKSEYRMWKYCWTKKALQIFVD